MPILWDSVLTAAMAAELDRDLRHARLRAVHLDHEGRSALLFFRECTLALRLHPDEGSLVRHDPMEPVEGSRSLQAELMGVSAPADDRILLMRFRKVRGGRERILVAVELMTNQWNLVVAEGDDDRIRHALRERAGDRAIAPGRVYAPPPPSDREGGDGRLEPARWREILGSAEGGKRKGALLSRVAWTSALNAPALLATVDAAGPDAALGLWTRLGGAARSAEPVLLERKGALQPYPLPLPGTPSEPADSLLGAMARAREEGATALVAVPTAWITALEERLRSAEGRAGALERELDEAPDPAAVRAVGDLILARFSDVPRGSERAILRDFEGDEVEVELDPTLTPDGNAARYYDRAARAARARERLPALEKAARAEAGRLRELLARVRQGEAGVDEIRGALPEEFFHSPASPDEGPVLPYRRYRSSGGLEIRVGRGPRSNDDLTFRHSRPDDVWLHARHTAGAHVILRWDGDGNPPARDLAEAATLAALSSKARTSGSVPVDWTRRKYVRKPRKAPPGAVLPDRVQTVFVEPDPALESRLRV